MVRVPPEPVLLPDVPAELADEHALAVVAIRAAAQRQTATDLACDRGFMCLSPLRWPDREGTSPGGLRPPSPRHRSQPPAEHHVPRLPAHRRCIRAASSDAGPASASGVRPALHAFLGWPVPAGRWPVPAGRGWHPQLRRITALVGRIT